LAAVKGLRVCGCLPDGASEVICPGYRADTLDP